MRAIVGMGAPVHLRYCEGRLSVFRRIFAGNLVDLLPSQLLWRYPGWTTGVAEEAVQAGRRHDPEQEQFMLGIDEPMPSILGNEYRSALPKRVLCIVQCENSAAFQNVEGFVHLQVSVDRNTCTGRHLLRPQGEIVGACGRADLDRDLAMVAKMNELFAFGGAEHISLWRCGLSPGHASPQYSADADAPQPSRKDRRFCSSAIMTISSEVRRFVFQGIGSCDKRLNRRSHSGCASFVMTPQFTMGEYH